MILLSIILALVLFFVIPVLLMIGAGLSLIAIIFGDIFVGVLVIWLISRLFRRKERGKNV